MKILVLEESAMARTFISEELAPASYEIVEVATPDEAMELLSSDSSIDLMTMRMYMEGMDCFEFLKCLHTGELSERVREVGNERMPVVIVTSSDTLENRLHGFQVGAADFLEKPWKSGKLLHTVERILGQSEEVAGLKVMVAEDSGTARRFITSCLERLGVEIIEVDDGLAAWNILAENPQAVDILITDLTMKDMHGDELCLKIRRELGLADMPIIFLSGNDDRERTLSLFKLGATDYIQKPFYQEELVARMRVHLQHRKMHLIGV
jgi:DNA-binding response OmpR family regulator